MMIIFCIISFSLIFVITLNISVRLFIRKYCIAHALGTIHGYKYTNSLEAFKSSYAKGFRQFEVDIYLTTDNKIVCFHPLDNPNHGIHDITSFNKFSYEEFKSGVITDKINLKLTFLDIDDLIHLMEKYKNIKVLLHIFEKDESQYAHIIDEFIRLSPPEVNNRLIFQPTIIYKDIISERKNNIKNIMTWVRKSDFEDMEGVVKFLRENNIQRIVTNKGNRHRIKELKKFNQELCVQIYPEESIFNILKYIIRYKADFVITNGEFTL